MAVTEIQDNGGQVCYDGEAPASAWLRYLLGVDFFVDVTSISVPSDRAVEHIGALSRLQRLEVAAFWPNTRSAYIFGSADLRFDFTDRGLQKLGTQSELRELDLRDSKVTDAGMACLSGFPNLEELNLCRTDVTDAGIVHIMQLTRLRNLCLVGTKVSDAAVQDLRKSLPQCEIQK